MQSLMRSKSAGVTGGRNTAGAGPGRDLLYLLQLSPTCSNPPRRGLAAVGVGVLGAPDPAPEAVTNYYITRPPPPGRQPFSNPFHAAPYNDRNRILRTRLFFFFGRSWSFW